ncbi:MAG: YidC/Oxa1 family membrane protein insertase [Ruminococcaceae bacterium]|nr:YidC/Oxa1 family membrane protein insertase [Oscillospiraceae bacterium]
MFKFISIPFGYLLEWVYSFTHNYAIALLIFAVVVKLVLFPFGIKQQKNSQLQARLLPKQKAIEKKYAGRDDPVTQRKRQEELTKLFQDEKYNPLSGCLPLLIQFPIIIALYDVIRDPLTYLMHLPAETVTKFKEIMVTFEKYAETKPELISEISIISKIKEAPEAFSALMTEIGVALEDVPNLGLFGMDLGETPTFHPVSSWLLILIPVISLVSSFLSSVLTKKFSYQPPSTQQTDSSMKVMQYAMPFMSLYIAFNVPAAVGLYWIYQNLLSPLQQFILSKMYKIPVITEEEIKAAEKLYTKSEKAAKKQGLPAVNKKRSIVYDDDDETVEDDAAPAAPKAKPVSSIGQAPLKDESAESAKNKSVSKKKSLLSDDDDDEPASSVEASSETDNNDPSENK